MAGLVPATPITVARPRLIYRGRRAKPSDDGVLGEATMLPMAQVLPPR